jgi:hypothetical protein
VALLQAAQSEAVASGDEVLVGAANEVSSGAADHQCCRILTTVRQSRIGRAALLGLVRSGRAANRHRVARNARRFGSLIASSLAAGISPKGKRRTVAHGVMGSGSRTRPLLA